MKVKKTPAHNLQQTLDEVKRLSSDYFLDMKPYRDFNIYQMFDFISKKIEYIKDPPETELVMRPSITIKRGAGDCDDKTVLFLAWLKLKRIPRGYSIVSDSANKSYHHIFPFTYDKKTGKIIDLDATYARNQIAVSKYWSKRLNFYL
jgi:transglutaminase-like putative cysteine protease